MKHQTLRVDLLLTLLGIQSLLICRFKICLVENYLIVFRSEMTALIYLSSTFVDSGGIILEYFAGTFIHIFWIKQ